MVYLCAGRVRDAVVSIGLVAACTEPPARDAWNSARTACELTPDLHYEWSQLGPSREGERNSLALPAGCPDVLLTALHAGPAALLRDLGVKETLDDHVERVRTGEAPADGIATLTWASAWLLGGDFGRVGDVDAGPFSDERWSEDFHDLAESFGADADDSLAMVLFTEVTRRVSGVSWLDRDAPETAAMQMMRGTHVLRVPREIASPSINVGPNVLAWALFHESVHARSARYRHVECEAPALQEGRLCDSDGKGAYGAGYAVGWAEIRSILATEDCPLAAVPGWVVRANMNSMREGWTNVVLSTLEPVPDPVCAEH